MSYKLKESREKKKISVDEVSSRLKIRKQYIIAMEEGVWDDIPGIAYKNGYFKMYCKFLGIPYSESFEVKTENNIDQAKESPKITYKNKLNIALGLTLILTIFIWFLIYNKLHRNDNINNHLENMDHKDYLIDPQNNTDIELKK